MRDLGGSSFDLNDFLNNGTGDTSTHIGDDFTPGEKISSLLNDIDDFVIQEKKVEKNRIDNTDDTDYMEEPLREIRDDIDSEQEISTFDLEDTIEAGRNRTQQPNRYEVLINEDDVYIPIEGESSPQTTISSIEVSEPTFVLDEEDVKKDTKFKTLNTRTILDFSGDSAEDISGSNRGHIDNSSFDNANDEGFQELGTPEQGMSSLQLLAELGLDASPVKVKSNNKKKQLDADATNTKKAKTTGSGTPGKRDLDIESIGQDSKSKKNRTAEKPRLKKQDPNNMIEDDVTPISHISGKSNRNLFDSLVSQMSMNSKDNNKEKIDITAPSKVREILDNLDDFEINFGRRSLENSSSTAAMSIAQRLSTTIETNGKHFIEVDAKDMGTEVQSILRNVYDLDVEYSGKDFVVKYKEIPTRYQEQRNVYLKEVLMRFRKLLLEIRNISKTDNKDKDARPSQLPLIFDYMENGISIITPLELKMIISTIKKGYNYEVKDNKILLWGVKQ